MNDQAAVLREKVLKKHQNSLRNCKTLAVLSGKGGVGKSNLSLNLSLALTKQKQRVLLFDMDIGMGNIDILIGQTASYTMVDLLEKKLSIQQIIKKGPQNLAYVAGGTGISSVFEWSPSDLVHLIQELNSLTNQYDYMIFDMGAGMSESVLKFLKAVDEMIVVTTPEPTSITDAYAAIKLAASYSVSAPVRLIINKTLSDKEGNETYERFNRAVHQFLNISISLLGIVPNDQAVQKAVNRQMPFLLQNPASKASISLIEMVSILIPQDNRVTAKNEGMFIRRLKRFFLER
ncbi:MinD/ParA family protein [Priestia megaterium]|uniref:MinD/ParA family protein n=1 Tax=Priestia megaterium TaxID=1404 RepID=UPI000BF3173E|nr:MinD/ParA family protein [Priestia megaterium]MCM3153284.1 MinD/ParA family protein [Priestia megaterium]MDC7768406.1 MinD/ParA family protein [Priestia megaterium]PEU70501.1 cobyrinic acid a,c-diamide synthase [Priestia megaterium]PFW50597.1 cobyrinic acid a,c-diamide synthase [Priestia megaterium]PGR04615.1 cobyrinic acid a,c-diamide synthase [Priestia megaterium]